MTHCPSVNSQLIRCTAARHQKASVPPRVAGVKCLSHDHISHSAGMGGEGWWWKADLCKHKANKQGNPRGRGNPPRPGQIPLSHTSEMQSVDTEFGSIWSQKKTLILASFASWKIDTDPKCTHFSKSLVQSSILLQGKKKLKIRFLRIGDERKRQRGGQR